MKLFDETFSAIETKLNLTFKRHAVIAGNIANSETPGYRAREVDFGDELKRVLHEKSSSLEKTDSRHMDFQGSGESHIVFDNRATVGADGNSVDLEINMGKLASNAKSYSQAANLLLVKLRILRTAARGRGGI